jgi:glycosyltransferase involved in cell wall biosynthesis
MRIGILFAGPFPPTAVNGCGVYVNELTRKLLERGHSVTIITRGGLTGDQEMMGGGVKVFRVPFVPAYPFHVHIHGLFVNRLIGRLERKLDIIHAHSPYVPAVLTSLPLLTTIHTLEKVSAAHIEAIGILGLARKMSLRIHSLMEMQLFKHSDMLTADSSHVFYELNRFYGLNREGIVLGNGVDEKTFVPLQDNRANRGKYVLFVGRMDYRKGLFDLIECVRYVAEENPRALFVLAGSGPLKHQVSIRAAKMGIEKNLLFTGYVSKHQLIELYQNASVFVLPSHYEGLPTVMLEAMACGVPVVATSIGGQIDVISDKSNGFLVPVGSTEDMARPILRLLSDKDLAGRMGKAARETIERGYTWDKISEKVLDCYQRL